MRGPSPAFVSGEELSHTETAFARLAPRSTEAESVAARLARQRPAEVRRRIRRRDRLQGRLDAVLHLRDLQGWRRPSADRRRSSFEQTKRGGGTRRRPSGRGLRRHVYGIGAAGMQPLGRFAPAAGKLNVALLLVVFELPLVFPGPTTYWHDVLSWFGEPPLAFFVRMWVLPVTRIPTMPLSLATFSDSGPPLPVTRKPSPVFPVPISPAAFFDSVVLPPRT